MTFDNYVGRVSRPSQAPRAPPPSANTAASACSCAAIFGRYKNNAYEMQPSVAALTGRS